MAIFGDMGVYAWNNMMNMKKDVNDDAIDLVVHMGDHCYNIGGSDDRRGDGYMEAYQQVRIATACIVLIHCSQSDNDLMLCAIRVSPCCTCRYMQVIATVPWLPIVGNHEFYDGDQLQRYTTFSCKGLSSSNVFSVRPTFQDPQLIVSDFLIFY